MTSVRHTFIALLVAVTSACNPLGAPALTPIVRESTPPGLKPAKTSLLLRALDALLPSAYAQQAGGSGPDIAPLFTSTYPKLSGGEAKGLIFALLEDLDFRVQNPNGGDCLNQAAYAHRVDMSQVSPALDLTLQLQCVEEWNGAFGDQSGPGSGLAFGKSGTDAYSMWLYLNQKQPGRAFGYFANLTGASGPSRSVDFMFLSTDGDPTGLRLKAVPATSSFEMTFAGGGIGPPGNAGLNCGFRMISNGAVIATEGGVDSAAGTCAGTFSQCTDAQTLLALDESSCSTLRQSFTLDTIQRSAVNDASAAMFQALAVANGKR